jgi:hypothetical protein
MRDNLIDAIAVTWELCGGQKPSDPAMKALIKRLDAFEPKAVIDALVRCQNELKGRISIGDIISRIDDGHLGPDEAWAMMPKTENESVVWTDEMANAFFASNSLKDPTAARMAFKEAYAREVGASRSKGARPVWRLSPGNDRDSQEAVVLDAVVKGRLEPAWALREFPQIADRLPPQLGGGAQPKQLPPQEDCPTPSEISGLIGTLGRKMGK